MGKRREDLKEQDIKTGSAGRHSDIDHSLMPPLTCRRRQHGVTWGAAPTPERTSDGENIPPPQPTQLPPLSSLLMPPPQSQLLPPAMPPPLLLPPPYPYLPLVAKRQPFEDLPPLPSRQPVPIMGGQRPTPYPCYLPLDPRYQHSFQACYTGARPLAPVQAPVVAHPGESHNSPAQAYSHAARNTRGPMQGDVGEDELAPLTGVRPGKKYPNTQIQEGGKYSPYTMPLDTNVN